MAALSRTLIQLNFVSFCLTSEGHESLPANASSNFTQEQGHLRGSNGATAGSLQNVASVASCEVGVPVHCPLSAVAQLCSGNQCCPDGSTCPSAEHTFDACEKPKVEDCTSHAGVNHLNPGSAAVPSPAPHHTRHWPHTLDRIGGHMNWCEVEVVPHEGTLRNQVCGHHTVKALSYNLYWWNLFRKHGGRGGSAGRLIAHAHESSPFDFMGFQECENIERVLRDGGLSNHFGHLVGEHATAIAYNKDKWHLLTSGGSDVAEDGPKEYYGQRPAHWGRFRHKGNGKIVFFLNHHGALPKNTGGLCGTRASAYNIMKVIALNAHQDDAIIIVGDFNSDAGTKTHRLLAHHLHDIYTGQSFGGVDHIYSSCPDIISRTNLGDGGSDHDALEVLLKV